MGPTDAKVVREVDVANERYFYQSHCPESNFYRVKGGVTHQGLNLPTTEHHLMRAKATLFGDARVAAQIERAPTALHAKRLGRKVAPFDPARWDRESQDIMTAILVSKFGDNAKLKAHLLAQKGGIYEASPKDRIWGIGISVEAAERGEAHRGENRLGKALMAARDQLMARE